jgi:hypothetical protein
MDNTYDYINETEVTEEIVLEKSHRRAKRRQTDRRKAKRKQNICKNVYHYMWYDNLHQYSKNKIHCSCQMCRFRSVYEPDAKPIQDQKRILSMNQDLKEYFKTA